jgi:hypothetical protein
MRTAGTRERIMERHKYQPREEAIRESRLVGKAIQTYKQKDDIILDALGRKHVVDVPGWH